MALLEPVYIERISVPGRHVELITVVAAATGDTVLTTIENPSYVIVGEYGIGGALNSERQAGYTLAGKTITFTNLSTKGAAVNVWHSLLVIGN